MPNWSYSSLNPCVTSQVGFKTFLSFVGEAQPHCRNQRLDCLALPGAESSPGSPLGPAMVLHRALELLQKCWRSGCQQQGSSFYNYATFAVPILPLVDMSLDSSQLHSHYSSLTPRPGRTFIGTKLPNLERKLARSPPAQGHELTQR